MKVQPNDNNVNMYGRPNRGSLRSFARRIMQKALDVVPQQTVNDSNKQLQRWDKWGNLISKPAENRAIMGATALLTQPAIDYYNHKVDEETRTVSRNRTIAKILAGTGVGVFVVRGPIYKAIATMTDPKGKSKYSKSLLPKKYLTELAKNEVFLKNYRSALSMSVALVAMCATNFLLDAPLTAYLTNKFNEKSAQRAKEGSDG